MELIKEAEARKNKKLTEAKIEESSTPADSSGKWSVSRNLPAQKAKAAQSQNR